METDPEIRAPVQKTQFVEQANCTNNTIVFSF